VSRRIEAALPFWLDRPDAEAIDIAREVRAAGLGGLWVGEMATFDAFALATAIGIRTPGLRLNIGPLPVSVRNPAGLALGASTVASLTGAQVGIALGASSPAIVTGWHDREWLNSEARMRETIECLRQVLSGQRSDYDGRMLRSNGFRLRHPLPDAAVGVGVFGPRMTRLAAVLADELVLNLATPARVAEVRRQVDEYAADAGRKPPHLTVWVPVAVNPGEAARRQLAGQLAVYLAPPGYGEMFSDLGFADLVARARAGARRAELAAAIPAELHELMGATGSPERVTARLAAYLAAGADTVAVVPATADDPAGRAALKCAADCLNTASTEETVS
jgi:probable F420-dependent oxidoreductase